MRAVEVIVEEEVRKKGSAVVTGLIRSGISPLADDGLDEAFGFAIGLRAIRSGDEMFDPQLTASGGEESGAVGRAAIGEEALNGDAMSLIELDGLMESVEDAGDGFVRQQTGESQAGMIVNGDMQAFDSGVAITNGAIAGGADAGTCETAQFLEARGGGARRDGRVRNARPGAWEVREQRDDGGRGDATRGREWLWKHRARRGSGRRSGAVCAEPGCERRAWNWFCAADDEGWRNGLGVELGSRIALPARASGGRFFR